MVLNMENNKYLISVIIPVYNMEKYLQRCMDSVFAAAIDHMQIILVDDGSKDESPAMCDRYAMEHSNVLVVHQENGGLSAARNAGMAVAQGEYIFFLDSDDRIHREIFRKFVDHIAAKNYRPDMVICNAEFVHTVTDKRIPMTLQLQECDIDNIPGEQAIGKILSVEPTFEWYCWRYFYNRKYLLDAGHQFLVGRCYEDVKWTPQVLAQARSVSYLKALGVHYTWCRPDSIVNAVTLKKTLDKVQMCADTFSFARDRIADPYVKQLVYASCAETYMSSFRTYCLGLKEFYPYLKEYAYLADSSKGRLGKVFKTAKKLFGFPLGCWITKQALKVTERKR